MCGPESCGPRYSEVDDQRDGCIGDQSSPAAANTDSQQQRSMTMFSDTPRSLRQGGSSFNERTCPMHTTTHSVEALSVTRVRFPARSPFPLCPRVRQRGFDRVFPRCAPTVRWACALLRDSTLSIWELLDT